MAGGSILISKGNTSISSVVFKCMICWLASHCSALRTFETLFFWLLPQPLLHTCCWESVQTRLRTHEFWGVHLSVVTTASLAKSVSKMASQESEYWSEKINLLIKGIMESKLSLWSKGYYLQIYGKIIFSIFLKYIEQNRV